MANLKEVRNRITSVNSTMQITSAMKMVSAAKLKRAQDAVTQMRPFSEKLTPYDVVFILNRYFKRMVKVIEENHGRVDNYIGDGMVAIFGINDEKNSAEHAVKAAIDMRDEMDDMKPY